MISALSSRNGRRSVRRVVAVALLGVLALGACTSDPGPRRVAQDIIKAEALENPELDAECMLKALDQFTDADLEGITQQLDSANEGTQTEGQAALDEFTAALNACN